MSLANSKCQVQKKEVEKQKNLFFGVKFERIPRIKNVDENYVFGILLRTDDLSFAFVPLQVPLS